jgi:hypothetical protein
MISDAAQWYAVVERNRGEPTGGVRQIGEPMI